MAATLGLQWHEGEVSVQQKLRVPDTPNPTQPFLYPRGAVLVSEAPLAAVGALDSDGNPWSSLWGGSPGFAQPLGQNLVGMTVEVVPGHDPVIQACREFLGGGNPTAQGKLMSGLTMDLNRRNRVKLAGRMMAGAVADDEGESGVSVATGSLKLVTRIDQSLANCPKYINRKEIQPAKMSPKLESDSARLSEAARKCVAQADTIFVSSSHNEEDMDTNHRGGAPGFTRTTVDEATGSSMIVWPEYSGNRLYQTLGNLQTTPRAGLVFPNFDTGDVLYVTGETKLLFGKDANAVIPRSNLAVQLTVARAIFVESGLPFRGVPVEASPYNPRIRPLADEALLTLETEKAASNSVTLVAKTQVTPTVVRYRWRMTNPADYKPGQWAALDFSDELDIGYSHMRNDDPTSLNDDFVRTFTISSSPPPKGDVPTDCFEMTIRTVGSVTEFMSKMNTRSGIVVPVRGFGGDFQVKQQTGNDIIPFIAGGVGITPLLGCLPYLDASRIKLFWSIPAEDIDLVVETVKNHPDLAKLLQVYITGKGDDKAKADAVTKVNELGGHSETRRIQEDDLKDDKLGHTWYLCTSTGLRNSLLAWLRDKDVHYENFNF